MNSSKYRSEFVLQAARLHGEGAGSADLAASLGVTERTIYKWRKRYPEFDAAVRSGTVGGALAAGGTAEEIRPQAGPQNDFLSSRADIAIYGGAAGGGKTFALLLEAHRHAGNAKFSAVIFRRTLADVQKPGALFDTSMTLYGDAGGKPHLRSLNWTFPGGGRITFGHLEYETTKLHWQGAQIALICFDELTHFSRAQFFYLLSRNRSLCGIKPYVRATTNPDSESWVAELIAWWIDQETGLPIPQRAGALRYFARRGDVLEWADSADDLRARFPGCAPKSLTFIPARLEDNAILVAADPGYRANLLALPTVERERLLGGNWKIRPAAGLYFQRRWVTLIDPGAVPPLVRLVRGWDLAATPKTAGNDPDWTAGTKIGATEDGRYVVCDHTRMRGSPYEVEAELRRVARADGTQVEIALPQDPGQAGKVQAAAHARLLAGYTVRSTIEARASGGGDAAGAGAAAAAVNAGSASRSAKIARFGPFSAQAQAGNVLVVAGDWNEVWFAQLEAFPTGAHDDDADATSRAFATLLERIPGWGLFEYYRIEAGKLAGAPATPPPGEAAAAPPSGVKLRRGRGMTHSNIYGYEGRAYLVDADGTVVVHPDDVGPLIAIGFEKV